MTDLLDRLRKLREGATSGPWVLSLAPYPAIVITEEEDDEEVATAAICEMGELARAEGDAALIVALVNALHQIEAALELAEADVAVLAAQQDRQAHGDANVAAGGMRAFGMRDFDASLEVAIAEREAALAAYRSAGEAK